MTSILMVLTGLTVGGELVQAMPLMYMASDAGGDSTGPSTSSVTFSVDMTGVDLQGQVPTVNGAFNGWCGDCAPMTDEDGDNVWDACYRP